MGSVKFEAHIDYLRNHLLLKKELWSMELFSLFEILISNPNGRTRSVVTFKDGVV